jgi:hypothetical protein
MSRHLQNIREEHSELVEFLEQKICDAIGHLSFQRVSYDVDPAEGPETNLMMSWKVTDPQFAILTGCFLWWTGRTWVLSDRPTPRKAPLNECFLSPDSAIQTWVSRTKYQVERELRALSEREADIARNWANK